MPGGRPRVIDFHTHPYRPGDLAPATRAFLASTSAAVREHGDRLADPRFAAALLRAQGVERAVVLPEHCPATSGNVRTETVIEFCRAAPDFYLPFASVDPNTDADPAGLLRRYIRDGPVHGLKLYPSYQFFYPNERRLYPLYEACVEHRLPVMFHIGTSVLPGTRLKYCDPIYLDDVAVDFPELVIVMAHGGRGWWYDACATLASLHVNVYIDVTGLVPSKLLDHFPNLERLADKVVFGSDWPAMPKSVEYNAERIASLGLSPEATAKILYHNAARLLGLGDGGDGDGRR
ncbi:MAG TPA: amidohydrolase family protein [Longimicrobiales bacterium]